ncbi:MAG: multidrug transporter [Pseudomonadota bacterium]
MSNTMTTERTARPWHRQVAAVAATLGLLSSLVAGPVYAIPEDEPGGVAMVGDVLVARPVGAAMTAIGTVAFIVSLPLSALGGNVGKAAEKLVVDPARETFVRCLGCRNTGRYHKPKD